MEAAKRRHAVETVNRLLAFLRHLIHARSGIARAVLRNVAVLGALTLVVRYVLARKAVVSNVITEPGRVGRRIKSHDEEYDPEEYDVVIVGGGTAGCVLASRLSEDPSIRVLLLEAGGSSVRNPLSRIPALYHRFFHSGYDYDLYTVPQSNAGGKAKYWPRGRMLGGCSSMNAMIFHHGAPSDFDQWAEHQRGQEGASDWAYENFNRYFLKFEKYHPSKDYALVDLSLRGSAGPVDVGYHGYTSQATKSFLQACDQAGLTNNPDLNTPAGTLGSSKAMTFIDSQGRRVTTESAYLTPSVLARSNLKVASKAKVTKIIFDQTASGEGGPPRAVGVRYSNLQGELFEVKARKEVILSAGAVHTPQILMLSGIGTAAYLAEHRIPALVDLPGVGSHLMDHPVVDFHFRDKSRAIISGLSSDPESLRNPISILHLLSMLVQYRFLSRGPLASNVAEAIAFTRSSDSSLFARDNSVADDVPEDTTSGPSAPDIEIYFTPLTYTEHGTGRFPKGHHFALHTVLLRPTSKGTIRLQSSNPFDPPIIDPEYLSTCHDIAVLIRAARLVGRIVHTDSFEPLLDPSGETEPILNHGVDKLSEDEIAELIRSRVETLYHPTSTARMAPREDGGVVDPLLRVYGVDGLRVVDASIFPTITSGHTVSPTIAVAEKAADLIKEAVKAR